MNGEALIKSESIDMSFIFNRTLEKVHNFKVKPPWKFKNGEKRIGKHKQVRKNLKKVGKEDMETSLKRLAKLRKKADYEPYQKITTNDLNQAIKHMKKIFNNLKFD